MHGRSSCWLAQATDTQRWSVISKNNNTLPTHTTTDNHAQKNTPTQLKNFMALRKWGAAYKQRKRMDMSKVWVIVNKENNCVLTANCTHLLQLYSCACEHIYMYLNHYSNQCLTNYIALKESPMYYFLSCLSWRGARWWYAIKLERFVIFIITISETSSTWSQLLLLSFCRQHAQQWHRLTIPL